MSVKDDIKLEEYRSLLEEHRKNRSFLFERPLTILGLVAAAMSYLFYRSDVEFDVGLFVLAGLMTILCFNLWFTGNRLHSDARIVAYMQLVHEGDPLVKWIGWENSLRDYRKWMFLDNSPVTPLNKLSPLKGFMYPATWWLHSIFVFIILAVALIKGYPTIVDLHSVLVAGGNLDYDLVLAGVGVGFNFIAALFFSISAFGSLRPSNLNASIELEREIWIRVFDKNGLNVTDEPAS